MKIFDPIKLPTAKLVSFLKAATKVVDNSGIDVPIATILTEITLSLIFRIIAISLTPFTRKSEPIIKRIIPTNKFKMMEDKLGDKDITDLLTSLLSDNLFFLLEFQIKKEIKKTNKENKINPAALSIDWLKESRITNNTDANNKNG